MRCPIRLLLLSTSLFTVCLSSLLSGQMAGKPSTAKKSFGAPATTESGGPLILEPQVFRDPSRGNMPAYTFLVPEGWTTEGGVTPPGSAYHVIPYISDITIEAPDLRGVRFIGPLEFGYSDLQQLAPFTPLDGRPFMPMHNSLGSFWQTMAQLNPAPGVTNLQVVAEEVLPEESQLVQRQLAPLYQSTAQENGQLAPMGMRKTFDVHARKLVIRYQKNGTPIEATIISVVRHTIYYLPNGMVKAAMWNIDNTYAIFGPVGTDYLNDPALAAIVRSRQVMTNWQVAVQEWYLRKQQQLVAEGQARIAAAARAAATTQSSQSDDLLDMSFNSWKRRNAMTDAGQASSVNAIHERTTYATPTGGTVNLPSYYNQVYTDQQGNYVLHNNANWNINTDPAFNHHNWQAIQPVQ